MSLNHIRRLLWPAVCVLLIAGLSSAQSLDGAGSGQTPGPVSSSVLCESTQNNRLHCAADTSAGGATATQPTAEPTPAIETWGEFDPGKGFLIGRSSAGEPVISGADAVWKKIIGSYSDYAGRQLTVLQDVYKSESDSNQGNQAIGALRLASG